MESATATVSSLLAIAATAVLWFKFRRSRRLSHGALPYPPGPPGHWLLKNLKDMPKGEAWLTYTQWAALYGPVVHVRALGTSIVVLNTLEACVDLLDKRGAMYSNRANLVMINELITLGKTMGAVIEPNIVWKQQRRFALSAFGPQAVKKYEALQTELALKFLRSLIDAPDKFFHNLERTSAEIIFTVTYGLDIDKYFPEFLVHAEVISEALLRCLWPGAFLVDLLPVLRHVPAWMPGAGFQRYAATARAHVSASVDGCYASVLHEIAAGVAQPSFVADSFAEISDTPHSTSRADKEYALKWAAGSMHIAGLETTLQVSLAFIAAMALHPEIQARVHTELDAVLHGQLPKIADRPRLPYLEACLKETMRWATPVPTGVPHVVNQDDEYCGYHIPRGAIVMPNIWAIAHAVDDANIFRPERFLADDVPLDPRSFVFGFGRRICPGRHIAEGSVFAICASLMTVFGVTQRKDAPIDLRWTSGVIMLPEPFVCNFELRSPAAGDLLQTSH